MNTKQNKETNDKSNSNDLDKEQVVPLNKSKLDTLTVNDLKKELNCILESTGGKKVDLQDQLRKCLDKPRYSKDYLKNKDEL